MNGALSWPFLRLYALVLLYFSANAILNVVIPLKGNSLGATNTTIGIIMGAYLFTTMFFRPWAGYIIHKYGPVKVLRVILLINAVALILYTFTGLGGYFTARILQGVCTAFFSMSLQIAIIDALPQENRSQGISLYSLCSYIPGILGPLLAIGIWQEEDGTYFAVVMVAIAILTGLVGYGSTINSHNEVKKAEPPLGKNNSFSQLFKNRYLFRCSIIMLVSSMVFGAVTTFVPLYAEQVKNGHAGIYLMVQAATVVAARFTLMKKIPSDGKWHSFYMMGTLLMLTLAAQSISFANVGGAFFFYTAAVLMGVAQAIIYPTLTTYLTFVLPVNNRNTLLGLFIATADLGVSLGSVVMGPIADALSYSFMYTICAVFGILMVVFAYGRQKQFVS
ncbi:staphylopine family metallophore export MFS transporter CntE [Priestia megaterium]|uniref:staphylopine family metallophore export MFS transporter CntE n=1 Tax=Priestia megaterium TaxID=1404 RepID=UPI00203E5959|nr:MFS transporter [Priestia megaterium]MCM3184533.1 MFS transporter [Priestia megaterium]